MVVSLVDVKWDVSFPSSSSGKSWVSGGYQMRGEFLSLPTLQVTAFLILFLLGGQIENQLLSTGAFEVYLNGKSDIALI